MARQIIGVGATPNDGTGDPLRDAMIKVNNMTTELYSIGDIVYVDILFTGVSDGSQAAPFITIQAAIDYIIALGDASATKPYQVTIGAGSYNEMLNVPPWIYLLGEALSAVRVVGGFTPVPNGAGGTWQFQSITIVLPVGGASTWDFSAETGDVNVIYLNSLVLEPSYTLTISGNGAGATTIAATSTVLFLQINAGNCEVVADACSITGGVTLNNQDLAGVSIDPEGYSCVGRFSACHITSNIGLDANGTIAGLASTLITLTGCDTKAASVSFNGASDANRTLEFTPGSLEDINLVQVPVTAPIIRERQGDAFRYEGAVITPTITGQVPITVLSASFANLFPYMQYIVTINFVWNMSGTNSALVAQLAGDIPSLQFSLESQDVNNQDAFSYTFEWTLGGTTSLNFDLNMFISTGANIGTINEANIMLARKG